MRTAGWQITGAFQQMLKTPVAFFALVFINGHFFNLLFVNGLTVPGPVNFHARGADIRQAGVLADFYNNFRRLLICTTNSYDVFGQGFQEAK